MRFTLFFFVCVPLYSMCENSIFFSLTLIVVDGPNGFLHGTLHPDSPIMQRTVSLNVARNSLRFYPLIGFVVYV